jgi:DNA-binding NarL/FixJ family response regulator
LIVDDHEGFRRRARALLEAEGFDVVGEAADGETALAEAARLRPRLVLLDVELQRGAECSGRRSPARPTTGSARSLPFTLPATGPCQYP